MRRAFNMKRFQNILMAVAVAALAVVSCAKEEVAPETTVSEDKVYEYLFTLGEGDSKATLNDIVVTWQTGDYLGVVCKYAGGGYSYSNSNTKSAITPASGETPAKFLVKSYKALTVGGKVFCFFPYIDKVFEDPNITMSIPASQNNTINEMPMASIPFEVTMAVEAQKGTDVGDIKMLMLCSIARFKIYSSVEEYRSETVQSVTLTTDQAIAGSFTKDISTIDPKTASTLTISGYNEKSITETGITGTIGESSKTTAVFADVVVAPGTYTGNVVVRTDKASYEYSLGSGKTFERAHIKPLALDLGKEGARSEQKYFRKVTTDHDNFSGTYLVVYSEGNISKAFKGSSSNGDCIDVTIANDAIAATDALLSEAVSIVKENDKYYLKNAAGKYLYLSGTTSAINTSTDPKEVSITFDSQMKISSSTGTLKCRDGDKIKFYTGNNPFVDYYVLDGTEVPNDPNIVSLAVSDVAVGSTTQNVKVEIHCNKDWRAVAASDYLEAGEISIDGTRETTSFIVPFKDANTDVKNDKVVTVTISAGEGAYRVEKTINVTQSAPAAKLDLESKTGSATKDAGSTTINITEANFEWSVLGITVDGNTPEAGYSATKNTGEGYLGNVTLSYPENTTDKPKQIVVTIGDLEVKTVKYTLTQSAGQTASVLYELVTNVNNLASGDVILLGCSSKTKAAGALGSNAYFTSVDGTFSNGTLSSDKAIEITLGKSGDNWTLTTSEGTIGTSAVKSLNKAGTGTTTWTISISSEGTATIKSTTTTYGWIQYNASSPRFLNYASDQTAIQIYKKADSRTSQTISYSKETGSIDLYSEVEDLPTLIKDEVKTTVSFASSNTEVATIDATTGEITAVGVGKTTITAKAAGDNTYKPAEASFELEVTNSAPVITILKEKVDISSDAGTGLTISEAYSLKNVEEDSGIDVSWTGNITSATIKGGTVTYTINENTSTESPANSTITLKVKEKDTISGTITVTQAKKGGSVAPAAGTVLWKESFTGMDGKPTSAGDNTIIYSGDASAVTYTYSGSSTKIYNESTAGGTAPELLVGSGSKGAAGTGSFTASNISIAGCSSMTFSLNSNKSVTVEVTGATLSESGKSFTITKPTGTTISITVKNGEKGNVRIDDLTLTVN